MIIGEKDGLVLQIVKFTSEHLNKAEAFAERVMGDKNFTHFTHTRPGRMLSDEWEVYLLMFGNEVIGWGQIQKFPRNRRKGHIVRLGFIVAPEYRGKGYGGILVDYIIEKSSIFEKLTATTFSDNTKMLFMFLDRGFNIEGVFHNEEKFLHGDIICKRNVISLAKENL